MSVKRWRVWFHGRKNGAIGIFCDYCVDVDGETPQSARLAVYDTHEHLSNVRCQEIVDGVPCGTVHRP